MRKLKLFLILFITTILLGLGVSSAHAKPIWDLWEDVKCVADIDCTVQAASTAASNYITNVAIGKDFEEITEDDLIKMAQGDWDQGLAAAIGEVGGLAYSFPPIHVKDYVQSELADNLLNSTAEAQVTGAEALVPVQEVWSRMRDFAYALFAVVMVVIGFMIIFQREISPRVVLTFTNALPKVLLGLILITFSFPLIGLVIDVGAVFTTQLVLTIMEGLFGPPGQQLAAGGVAAAFSAVPVILMGVAGGGIVGIGIAALPALLLYVIFALAALVLVAITLIRVVVAYGALLIFTIFSPLLFLFGSLPGQEGSIINFFKNVLARALIFPVVLFFTLFGLGLATSAFLGTTANFMSGNFGGIITGALSTTGFLGAILALVMLAAAFKSPSLIEDALDIEGILGKR